MTNPSAPLPWRHRHLYRRNGAPGAPTTLLADELFINESDAGGVAVYAGIGDDGTGKSTSQDPVAGLGWLQKLLGRSADTTITSPHTLGITRAQIATMTFPAALNRFITSESAPWVRGTSSGPLAIADGTGQFWNLDVTAELTVKHFGAKGDFAGVPGSGDDDTAAFQAMLAVCGCLRVPEGVYRLTQALSTTANAFTMIGVGRSRPTIVFDAAVNVGLTIDQSGIVNSETCVHVDNITIATTQVAAGTAIRVVQYPNINPIRSTQRGRFTDVTIQGYSSTSQGWAKALSMQDCQNFSFVGCGFIGQGGDYYPNNTQAKNTVSGTAVELLDSGSGGSVVVPCELHFTNCQWYSWSTGFTANGGTQGIYFTSCAMIDVRDGVVWTANPSGQPLLILNGCHVNCYRSVATLSGVLSVKAIGCLFYIDPSSTDAGTMFDISNSTNGHVVGCEFWSYAHNNPSVAILFRSNVQLWDISGNQFVSVAGVSGDQGFATAISILASSSTKNNQVRNGNVFNGTFTVKDLVDANTASIQVMGHHGVMADHVDSAISVPSATSTLATFDRVDFDSAGFSTNGYTFSIPSGRGFRRARVTAGMQWDSNATGYRQIAIYKNNQITYNGAAASTVPAVSGAQMYMNVETGFIDVTEGDYFQLVLYQTSGAALNANNVFMNLEIVN